MTPAMSRALSLHQPVGGLRAGADAADVAAYRLANKSRASLLTDDWPAKVAAFRGLYQLNQHNNPTIGKLPEDRQQLQLDMLNEEIEELADAFVTGDFAGQVDAILDWIYVGIGCLHEMGFSAEQINLLMEEVHASNLTKTDDRGQPVFSETGKVLKGDNYVQADIAGLIREMQAGLGTTTLGGSDGQEG